MSKDLFGNEIPKKTTWKGGYRGMPGAGTKGEKCKTCDHFIRKSHNTKVYFKCDLVRMTNGSGTDILANAPACEWWTECQE